MKEKAATEATQHGSSNLQRRRAGRASASAVARLLCLCLLGGVSRSWAAPTALSIPGTLTVTIQPAEAVADGARWSIDGGAPQASDESVGNLTAGTHTIQFSNLPAWLQPEAVNVLVIGGREASVIAPYRPLPRFYFRATPEQRARAGTKLEFLVHTDDPADPQNPGPGTALQMTATPPPAGALTFDPASGRITYTPSVADRLPFTLRLATAQGLAGTFEVTPLHTRTLEESVIEYDRPLPDAESRDYILISEVPHAPEVFNDATNQTFTVSISGQTLVFAADHPAHLHRQYDGRLNIRALRLYADKVIIRSPLLLPQTAVTIQARELRFEGDGRIETTPRPRVRRPPGAVWEDDRFGGYSGDPGHAGGDVNVFVERFFSDATTATRFVMRGGDGGPAGEGRDGRSELTVGFLSADWFKLMARAGNPYCGFTENSSAMLYLEERFSNRVDSVCGERVTAFGEHAVPSGDPGRGGTGGALRSTLNLSAYAQLSGGAGGTHGGNQVRVNFEHRGISRLTSGGRTFLFRHYQTENVNPIVWNAIFDALTGQTVNSTLSAAQQSLISVLLAQQPVPVTNLLFFSQPAAHAEILLTKDVSTDNGTDFVIDDLLFELQYDFSPTTGSLRELNVRVSGDLAPVVALSQPDINSRQDGQGDFSRLFPAFTLVTLQAPASYGEFVFDRWFVNNQPQTTQVPAVAVLVSGNTQVEARYRLPAGPLVLTPSASPAGQMTIRFLSEPDVLYHLEQTPRLTNPVWTIVDTRLGDGTAMQFTRPSGPTREMFFRIRQGL